MAILYGRFVTCDSNILYLSRVAVNLLLHTRNVGHSLSSSSCSFSLANCLHTQVNFSYFEAGENKQALVKLVACER